MAGTVVTGIHSSWATGTAVLPGRPMGWVAERLIRGGRWRVRPAYTFPV